MKNYLHKKQSNIQVIASGILFGLIAFGPAFAAFIYKMGGL